MSEYDLQDDLNTKLKHYFDGKIVRKDLTKRVKEGANVPVYVLEYLLGKYCSQDDALIEQGVQTVKNILANNYVRPDEAQKILSKLKEMGSYSIIDVVTVKLDYKTDTYYLPFASLDIVALFILPLILSVFLYPLIFIHFNFGNFICLLVKSNSKLQYSLSL